MKFNILFFLAIIRGFFPEIREYEIYVNGIPKSEVKKIYEQSGWKPHRVTSEGVSFVRTARPN